MANPTLLGQVIFFNVKRGFGRIRSDEHPDGVFVHFSAIEGDSRVLVPHELVRFSYRPSPRGLRAVQVHRLSPRLTGQLLYFKQGRGEVLTQPGERRFTLQESDLLDGHLKHLKPGVALEFSPFESQAKEVVVVDPRPPLQRFAHLAGWQAHLAHLAAQLTPEPWQHPDSHQGGLDVLQSYLELTFQRLQQENKIERGRDQAEEPLAVFNTGLLNRQGQEVWAMFTLNRSPYDAKTFLPRPRWQLAGFVTGDHPQLQNLEHPPSRAYYFAEPQALVYDPAHPIAANWEELLTDGEETQTATRQLKVALERATRWANYDYQQVVPAYHQGEVVLLMPLSLSPEASPSLAAVLHRKPHRYEVVELLSLVEAYPLARLIAPVHSRWLHPSRKALAF